MKASARTTVLTSTRRAAVLAVSTATLLLGACGGGQTTSGEPTGAPASAPASSATSAASPGGTPSAPGSGGSTAAPAGGDAAFCGALKANGATGASFGPVQLQLPKRKLLAEVDAMLEVMGDVEPPAAISKAWSRQKTTLERTRTVAGRLDDDQDLGDADPPVDLGQFYGGDIERAQDTLTDYWFDHCH